MRFSGLFKIVSMIYCAQAHFGSYASKFKGLMYPRVSEPDGYNTLSNRFNPLELKATQGGKCGMPCQRKSHWISLKSVLERAHIPIDLAKMLKTKQGNMVDVGRCSGFCKAPVFPFIRGFTVSYLWSGPCPFDYRTGPRASMTIGTLYINYKPWLFYKVYIFQNMQTTCIPIKFDTLKTDIVINGKRENGPEIKNLIIKTCACTEIQIC